MPASTRPAFAVRSLAVNALAVTGAAVSAMTPAQAIQLGEVAVESALGQPFSARVPVEIGAGEILGTYCVSAPAAGKAELMRLPKPVLSMPDATAAGTYDLRITTTQPLYEPMYELQLEVRCPGTALLVRQYVLMLDLPGAAPAPADEASTSAPISAPALATGEAAGSAEPARESVSQRPAHARNAAPPGTPIEGGTRYRVAAGDTLSTIAARVSGRNGTSLWSVADRIFAANPDAFIGANPDLIKLGSEIVIPAPGTAAPGAPLPATVETPAPAPVTAAAAVAAPAAAPAPTVESAQSNAAAPPPEAARADAALVEPAAPAPGGSGEATQPAEAPVFQDEQASPPAAVAEAPAAAPAAVEPADDGAPPWLAALLGLLIGAGVSVALLRDRLLGALRGLLPSRARTPRVGAEPAQATAKVMVGQVVTHVPPTESTMVVVEEMHDDTDELSAQRIDRTDRTPALPAAAAARAYTDTHPDSDLSRLFGDEPEPQGFAPEADMAALPSSEELDLDLSAATPDVTIDQDIGWIGDETALTPTQKAGALYGSGGDTVEQLDLETLSQKATSDQQISQTLKEALNLLENDYEDEFTASQVVDRKKLDKFLDDGDEDTMIRTGTDQIPRR